MRQGGSRRAAAQLAPRPARAGPDPRRRRAACAPLAPRVRRRRRRAAVAVRPRPLARRRAGRGLGVRGPARGGLRRRARRRALGRRRRPVLHPLHRRDDRHLEGRPPHARVDRRGDGQPGDGGARRDGRRLHAPRPDVPHPGRARDELPRARPARRAHELRAAADARGDRGRARQRLSRDHDDGQLHDGRAGLRPVRPQLAAARHVRRRPDGADDGAALHGGVPVRPDAGLRPDRGVHVLLPAALGPPGDRAGDRRPPRAELRAGVAPHVAAGRGRGRRSRCRATARRWGRSSSAARR